jgi:carbamoyltransferase
MIVLGVHGGSAAEHDDEPTGFGFHDSAAVLLRDGEIVAAVEEERLDRIKHSNCFPVRAIRWCLQEAGVTLSEVDKIATNVSQYVLDRLARISRIEDPSDSGPVDGHKRFAARFERAFGADISNKLIFCNHHLSHAWSAYVPSGFDETLILSIDGDGDDSSGMVLVGSGKKLKKLREFPVAQSLGNLYQGLIKLLGYNRFDEYKVMGLAPYGDPSAYREVLKQCYRLLPEGNYALESAEAWFGVLNAAALVEAARRRHAPFEKIHMDFAASVQELLETIVLHVLRHYRAVTGQRRLCLAGGVAHNCTMNGVILRSGLFDSVFVQPAAHDAGGALGAAWSVYYETCPHAAFKSMPHLALGPRLGSSDFIERRLDSWRPFVDYRQTSTVAADTAKLLADGAVVGWAQGRSEFGPRALGNRSILADPRPADNKLRINEMVKKREQYRPFAPSVLIEQSARLFDVREHGGGFPYMIFVLEVRPEVRQLLGAVTHIDGTARVQTVSKHANPVYWDLLCEFDQLTGIPALLNTSFNNHAEPIVNSVDDVVTCFLTTGLEYLVIDRFIVTKKSSEILDALPRLVAELPAHRRLVRGKQMDGSAIRSEATYQIIGTKSPLFERRSYTIGAEAFRTLMQADGRTRLCCLLDRAGIGEDLSRRNVLSELFELWSERTITLAPEPV